MGMNNWSSSHVSEDKARAPLPSETIRDGAVTGMLMILCWRFYGSFKTDGGASLVLMQRLKLICRLHLTWGLQSHKPSHFCARYTTTARFFCGVEAVLSFIFVPKAISRSLNWVLHPSGEGEGGERLFLIVLKYWSKARGGSWVSCGFTRLCFLSSPQVCSRYQIHRERGYSV